MDKLVRLNRHQIQAAAVALARAFWDYPVARCGFPTESERERRLPYFFESSLSYGIRYGEVYASSLEMEGIAIWLPSNRLPFTYWRMLWSGALLGMFKVGRQAGRRMQPIGDHVDATQKRLAPFEHWYLLMLGVDPRFQKQGISSKLVRPMLERLRMEGLPCYVDTLDEQNVDLYKHFGFELLERSAIPGTNLHCWAFLKKP
jgi:ribosomal protein S18 acetylase RimI-like enzyme